MTKLELFAKTSGLKLVAVSSVWSIHNTDHLCNLAKKKGTNLHNEFLDMKRKGLSGGFTLVVGCIGRSGHSKSEIGIFAGVVDGYDYDEVFINEPNSKYWAA